jgi:hypothetical protein
VLIDRGEIVDKYPKKEISLSGLMDKMTSLVAAKNGQKGA